MICQRLSTELGAELEAEAKTFFFFFLINTSNAKPFLTLIMFHAILMDPEF